MMDVTSTGKFYRMRLGRFVPPINRTHRSWHKPAHCYACSAFQEHVKIIRTSQATRYVSATETNQLMLHGETAAVYCENHTEHTDILCGQSAPHRKHITISAAEPNRLMFFGETVAVYCENRTEHTEALCGQSVPHRKHIASPLQYPTG
jgi:hypothetical protein